MGLLKIGLTAGKAKYPPNITDYITAMLKLGGEHKYSGRDALFMGLSAACTQLTANDLLDVLDPHHLADPYLALRREAAKSVYDAIAVRQSLISYATDHPEIGVQFLAEARQRVEDKSKWWKQ